MIDASVLLPIIQQEPQAEAVERALASCAISAVNLSEAASKMIDRGFPAPRVQEEARRLNVEVVPFDTEQALDAGLLRPATGAVGLSLGDRACLCLARKLGVPALTTDRAWVRVDVGVDVRVIR